MKENSIEEDKEIIKYNMKIIRNVMNNFEDELCENMQIKTDEVNKAIEHILSDYKRVLKENEKLNSKIPNLEQGTEILMEINTKLTNELNDSISKQKVKDKIEELKEQYNVRELDFIKTTQDIRKIIIQSLEELLEGRE